jgi:hypothetical protein
MLNEHDEDLLLRCCRLGHEIHFGYCRQETGGKPCRLILNCWWERFDVRSFLQAHLPEDAMAQVESASISAPPVKLLSLVEMAQRVKDRLPSKNSDPESPPKHD